MTTPVLSVSFTVLLCKSCSDFGKKERERAWRVTRKLGDFGRERECLENHWKAFERTGKEMDWMAGCCIGPY